MKVTIHYPEKKKWFENHPIVRVMKNDISKTHLKSGDSYTMELKDADTFWIKLGGISRSQRMTSSGDITYQVQIGDRLKLASILHKAIFVITLVIALFVKEWYEALAVIVLMVVILFVIYFILLKNDITLQEVVKNENNRN